MEYLGTGGPESSEGSIAGRGEEDGESPGESGPDCDDDGDNGNLDFGDSDDDGGVIDVGRRTETASENWVLMIYI